MFTEWLTGAIRKREVVHRQRARSQGNADVALTSLGNSLSGSDRVHVHYANGELRPQSRR